jgi:two-component system OmpR family response regulator
VRELVARIRSVLRRTGLDLPANSGNNRVRFDGWELQRSERHLRSPGGLAVPLSNSEYQLLSTFLRTPRRAVSRDDLASGTRGQGLQATSRSVDLMVSRLRRKLMAPDERTPLINAVRGVGYRFDAQSVEVLA